MGIRGRLFADKNNILMYTSELTLENGKRICLNEPSQENKPITVKIAPGVTTGELSEFFTRNNLCLMSDVILDKVTYGGVIATGCHGVGKDQLSVSDIVTGMSLVGADGVKTEKDLIVSSDETNSLKCNLGLFGVMTDITLKVEPMVIVKTENDFSCTVEDVFYNSAKLKNLWDENWSIEIFWFPFNSLEWGSLLPLGLAALCKKPWVLPMVIDSLVNWDPRKDNLWIRKINISTDPEVQLPCPSEVDYKIRDVTGLVSTSFGRVVSGPLNEHPGLVPSFLKAGFQLIKFYSKDVMYEPINKAIHYQSFIEVFPVLDMEFAFNATGCSFDQQIAAMQVGVDKCVKEYNRGRFPLSVAMEMRWIKSSDCLMCPAKAVKSNPVKGETPSTLYLEVLGIAGQKDRIWENFTIDVAKGWMEIKTNGKKPVPHWAKQWSYIVDDEVDIYSYIREAYGENMTKFKDQLTENELALFSNETLNRVLFEVPRKAPMKVRSSSEKDVKTGTAKESSDKQVNKKLLEDLGQISEKHKKSWEVFFKTLGGQVWKIPNAFPMMDIQKEWEFAGGLLDELGTEAEKHDILVDKKLFASFFQGP